MNEAWKRRDFLKLAGWAGIAGTVGCSREQAGELVSLVNPDEQSIPGIATWYATTCQECPAGCGMTVRTREGRATKVEGNTEHPLSRGGLCVRGQASLQGLYNPDRFEGPLLRGASGVAEPVTWNVALREVADHLNRIAAGGQRDRLAWLSGHRGPAFDRLARQWLTAFHSSRIFTYEPFSLAPLREANRILFGKPAIPSFRIAESDYLISFGADYLETWLAPVRFTREFAAMHGQPDRRPGKIVHIEPRLSLTAANADEWIAARPATELYLALALTHHIAAADLSGTLPQAISRRLRDSLAPFSAESVSALTGISRETIERLAKEFAAAKASLAIGGGAAVNGENATALQVAIQLLNFAAGRIGQEVRFDQALEAPQTASADELRGLVEAMNAEQVEILFLHATNPLHTLPAGLGLAEAIKKLPLVVSFSSFPDETTELAHVILPDHTPLEQWGDYRPATGVHSLMQPSMNPVFDTRQTADVLLAIARAAGGSAEAFPQETFKAYLKQSWREQYARAAGNDFESFWNDCLRHGGFWPEAEPAAARSQNAGSQDRAAHFALVSGALDFPFPPLAQPAAQGAFYLHAYPSSRYYDGRGANKPWLHEIPDPITNIVWDSWVEVHPETAKQLNVAEGDVLSLETSAGKITAPVYIYAGVRTDTVAMPLGLGHQNYGRYAKDVGANPVRLFPLKADAGSGAIVWAGTTVRLVKTGGRSPLVRTDGSLSDQGRGFSKVIPISALTGANATSAGTQPSEPPPVPSYPENYPPHEHKDYRWGMAINLSSCTGCGACVAACYAENNVPVVGKARVAQGRHMAWIRIERYVEAVSGKPDIRFTPMMCQQCDNAPCESVCPVYATHHSSDGLNVQVYNRCVGTRYCSNNCPYKVRTFNWFDYPFDEPLNLQLNPDVSVRTKGIMEKCTFCVQRIRGAKDHARDEGRKVRDGEAMPACAQSCPAQAMAFGNLLDSESAVSKLSAAQHGYRVLEELNTKPAVTYLPRIKQV